MPPIELNTQGHTAHGVLSASVSEEGVYVVVEYAVPGYPCDTSFKMVLDLETAEAFQKALADAVYQVSDTLRDLLAEADHP